MNAAGAAVVAAAVDVDGCVDVVAGCYTGQVNFVLVIAARRPVEWHYHEMSSSVATFGIGSAGNTTIIKLTVQNLKK